MTDRERVRADYAATGLSVDLHPTVLVQESLEKMKVVRARDPEWIVVPSGSA